MMAKGAISLVFFSLSMFLFLALSCASPIQPVKKVPKFTDENNAVVLFKLFIQNMEAKLSCPTNFKPISITWLKDGEPFSKRPLGRVIQKDHWLKLPGLLVAYDKANYTCVVETKFGQIQRTFEVDVIIQHRGPPAFTVGPENRTIFAGETAELNCRYITGDATYVEWVKHYTVNDSYQSSNGSFYINSIRNRPIIESDPGRLVIRNASESDSGRYTCIVSNMFGSIHQSAWLQIDPLPTSRTIAISSSIDAKTLIGAVVGVIGSLIVTTVVAVAIVSRRNKRRPATITFIKSPIYSRVNLVVPDDPEWEISQEQLQIGELIGEGAFGRVHIGQVTGAHGQTESTVVAVKMLKEGATSSEIQDLIWEMEIMKSIGHHVNIINFVGYCVPAEDSLMVLVEFAPHGNLREYLWKHGPSELRDPGDDYLRATRSTERPLTTKDLVLFAYQVARGMAYLASKKIVHRDLAARNVLVAEDRVLKIADFGLTRDVKEKEYYRRASNGRVPVKWMALESLMENCSTTKSDVWSYGILLWEIFSYGSNPYPSVPVESLLQVLQQGHRMERPRYASSEVYTVMLQCWQRNPDDRPEFLELVDLFDQMIVQSADLHYLNLEAAFDDSVFHDNSEGGDDRLTESQETIVMIHSQPHGSDSLYASMSSQHTLSPSNSGNLCVDSDQEKCDQD